MSGLDSWGLTPLAAGGGWWGGGWAAAAPGLPFGEGRAGGREVGGDQAGRELVVLADRVLEGDGDARVIPPLDEAVVERVAGRGGVGDARVVLGRGADAGLGDPDRVRLRAAARGERSGHGLDRVRAADVG